MGDISFAFGLVFGAGILVCGFGLGFFFSLKERQSYGHSRFEAGIATGIARERASDDRMNRPYGGRP